MPVLVLFDIAFAISIVVGVVAGGMVVGDVALVVVAAFALVV